MNPDTPLTALVHHIHLKHSTATLFSLLASCGTCDLQCVSALKRGPQHLTLDYAVHPDPCFPAECNGCPFGIALTDFKQAIIFLREISLNGLAHTICPVFDTLVPVT